MDQGFGARAASGVAPACRYGLDQHLSCAQRAAAVRRFQAKRPGSGKRRRRDQGISRAKTGVDRRRGAGGLAVRPAMTTTPAMSSYRTLRFAQPVTPVGMLYLDRPSAANAINTEMARE